MWPWSRKRKSVGQRGEDIAARYLQRNGFRILDRNVHLGRYELDIIARDGDTIVFVEVKTRRNEDVAPPEENVDRTKQRHIRAAAHYYIERANDPSQYYRFDLVSVVLPERGNPAVTLYRDAFPDE